MKKFLLLPAIFLTLSFSIAQNTIPVTLTTDKNPSIRGELRYAIETSTAGDIISIEVSKISLNKNQGEILIKHDLHITTSSKVDSATIAGPGTSRIFNFNEPDEQFPEPVVTDPTINKKIYGSLLERLILTNGVSADPQLGGDGGVVFLNNRSATFRNVAFRANRSDGDGGAIYATNGELTFEYCKFETNTSPNEGKGGALAYICDNPPLFPSPYLEINYCSFTNNECKYGAGGAVYLENYSNEKNFKFDIKNSTFSSNTALQGGAITMFNQNKATEGTIYQSTFSNNSSQANGGAIYVMQSGTLIYFSFYHY